MREGDGHLSGLLVLVTRPADQAEETAADIVGAGGRALVCPCLWPGPPASFAELDQALRDLGRQDVVAVASAHGARALLARLAALGLAGQTAPGHPLFAAVGEPTAAALRTAGWPVAVLAGESTGAGLARAIAQHAGSLQGKRVLLPRARHGREELGEALSAAGAQVRAVTAYEMIAATAEQLRPALDALQENAVDLVPLGSPRTATLLIGALGRQAAALLSRAVVGAIGPTTAEAVRQHGVAVDVVANSASFPALLREMAQVRRDRAS